MKLDQDRIEKLYECLTEIKGDYNVTDPDRWDDLDEDYGLTGLLELLEEFLDN